MARLKVPDDVSVVGFDGIALGEDLTPMLSSVTQPNAGMGRCAVELLVQAISSGNPLLPSASVVLPYGFRQGESYAAPPEFNMKMTLKKIVASTLLTLGLAACSLATAQTAICYNCPPEWADWASQLRAIKAKTGITVPPDNKNSGQSLAQLVAEKASPVADVTYLGVTFGIQAQKDGVVAAYKPANFNDIPDGLKDPQGNWFTIHTGTLGFMVNVDALKGKPVPRSWADLLKPEYKGLM
eukprot:gene55710-74390_t